MKIIAFLFFFAAVHFTCFCQSENDSTGVKFEIYYHWDVYPPDTCKNIWLKTLDWSKNEESCIYIFNGRDTFTKKPDHFLITKTGEHHLKVIAKGKNGKDYLYEKKLVIDCDPEPHFEIPNPYRFCGSEPDFMIYSDSTITEKRIMVFDRWGEMMFKAEGDYFVWNGTCYKNGKTDICPQGTYPYIFLYHDKNGLERFYFSHFQIIR